MNKIIRGVKYAYSWQQKYDPSKETIVCLHGFTGTRQTFQLLQDPIYNFLFIDLLGHGESSIFVHPWRYQLSEIVKDLNQLIQELGINQWYVLGYSMGARVALAWAIEHPSKLLGVILEAGTPGIVDEQERKQRKESDRRLALRLWREPLVDFVDFWQNLPLFSSQKKLPKEIQKKIRDERLSQNKFGLAMSLWFMGTGVQKNYWLELEELKQPVLYVVGEQDPKFLAIGDTLCQQLPHSTLAVIPDSGHCVHLEQSQAFANKLSQWLAKEKRTVSEEHVMKIMKVEQYQLRLPLVTPFQTSYGVLNEKALDLLILEDELGNQGYGELVSFEQPDYIEETIGADRQLIEQQLVPRLFQADLQKVGDVWSLFQTVQGNFMAKSALETAVWDLFAKREQRSLQSYFGSHKSEIPVGVSVGIHATTEDLIAQVSNYLEQGYQRIKVKIKPGYDIVPLSAIREEFPDVPLMADANSAYTFADLELFKQLDQLNLAMIEQPFHQRDFVDHARLQQHLQTKICLDENIRTLEDVKTAYTLGSCQGINLKIPRVGGITEALRIVDFCQTHQLLVWLGGMFESGIGRALNLQFASQNIFTFPGDISAADRYYTADVIKKPAKMERGNIVVPQGVGLGVELDWQVIEQVCDQKQTYQ